MKFAGTIEAMRWLHDNPELWDKKKRAGEAEAECRNCRSTRQFPLYEFVETGQDQPRFDDWHNVGHKEGRFTGPAYVGLCDRCWHSLREEGREMAVERGLLPCPECRPWDGVDVDSHELPVWGTPTHHEYIPFSEDEIADLQEKYLDARHLVCPNCRSPQDEMTEGTFETEPTYSDRDPLEFEGLVCECGWRGHEYQLSRVKA